MPQFLSTRDRGRLSPEPIRRHNRRPDQARQDLFLCGLSRKPADSRTDATHHRSPDCRAGRRGSSSEHSATPAIHRVLSNGACWASATDQSTGISSRQSAKTITRCTSHQSGHCVFPNANWFRREFNPISQTFCRSFCPRMAGPCSSLDGHLYNNSEATDLSDNKFSGRGDANTNFGLLTAYFYWDKFNQISPYWPGNAPLYPGFSVDGKGQTYNVTLGDTKTFSSASVNEFRLGYFRLDTLFNQPLGGKGVKLADLGFASGASGAPGIVPAGASLEGVPEIDFNDFIIGVPSRPNGLIDNIYQIVDNYSKIIGTHTHQVRRPVSLRPAGRRPD